MAEVSYLPLYEDDEADEIINLDHCQNWNYNFDSDVFEYSPQEQSFEVDIAEDALDLHEETFDRENQVTSLRNLLQQRMDEFCEAVYFEMFDSYDTGSGLEIGETNSIRSELDLDSGLGFESQEFEDDGRGFNDDFRFRFGSDLEDEDADSGSENVSVYGDESSLPVAEDANEGFDWEEVVDGDDAVSVVIDEEEDEEPRAGLDWEVLLTAADINRNLSIETDYEFDVSPDDYDVLFGQFSENEAYAGKPPASRTVIQNLPTVILTREDVLKNNNVCAVCKDEMSVGERTKELPCSHRYHGDCVLPWLKIRNTCPVCRHELATDDADYERRKMTRSMPGI